MVQCEFLDPRELSFKNKIKCDEGVVEEMIKTKSRKSWTNVGIEYEQGGYPPLVFGLKHGLG